jgi:hypothetical protein
MPYPDSPYHPGVMPNPVPKEKPAGVSAETQDIIDQLRIRIVGLRAERDDWMDKALAHEQVAAQLRVKLMESLNLRVNAEDGLPIFDVTAKFGNGLPPYLFFMCPRCGKKNRHGRDAGEKGQSDGHRCSHCPCWKDDGYYIREV